MDKPIPIEETDFYNEMELNRGGNLLEAARLKAELSQRQLAEAKTEYFMPSRSFYEQHCKVENYIRPVLVLQVFFPRP
jgi:hypothetical protein